MRDPYKPRGSARPARCGDRRRRGPGLPRPWVAYLAALLLILLLALWVVLALPPGPVRLDAQ